MVRILNARRVIKMRIILEMGKQRNIFTRNNYLIDIILNPNIIWSFILLNIMNEIRLGNMYFTVVQIWSTNVPYLFLTRVGISDDPEPSNWKYALIDEELYTKKKNLQQYAIIFKTNERFRKDIWGSQFNWLHLVGSNLYQLWIKSWNNWQICPNLFYKILSWRCINKSRHISTSGW